MIEVVGVRFKQGTRTYYFDPGEIRYCKDTKVIVETKNGLETGTVILENQQIAEDDIVLPLKCVIRQMTDDDWEKVKNNVENEKKAETVFLEKIIEEALDIQLVDVRYNFDATHVVFSYTADNRVDFRNLVKKLAQTLRIRIEMRQINMREKARLIGGVGPCGYDLCCNTFLQDLHGSTIKMVKNQKLTLVPERISGLCGKLLCCLRYENDTYTELAALLPDVNQRIKTPDGIGKVIYVNVLTQKIDVLFVSDSNVYTKKQYNYHELQDALLTLDEPVVNNELDATTAKELANLVEDTDTEIDVAISLETVAELKRNKPNKRYDKKVRHHNVENKRRDKPQRESQNNVDKKPQKAKSQTRTSKTNDADINTDTKQQKPWHKKQNKKYQPNNRNDRERNRNLKKADVKPATKTDKTTEKQNSGQNGKSEQASRNMTNKKHTQNRNQRKPYNNQNKPKGQVRTGKGETKS